MTISRVVSSLTKAKFPAACTDLTLYKLRELRFVLTDSPVNTAVPSIAMGYLEYAMHPWSNVVLAVPVSSNQSAMIAAQNTAGLLMRAGYPCSYAAYGVAGDIVHLPVEPKDFGHAASVVDIKATGTDPKDESDLAKAAAGLKSVDFDAAKSSPGDCRALVNEKMYGGRAQGSDTPALETMVVAGKASGHAECESQMAKQHASTDYANRPSGGSVSRSVVAFLACLAILIALWIIIKLQTVVVLAVISIVLSTGLAPAVIWLEKRKVPRVGAIFLVYVVVFVVMSVAFTLILIPLIQQAIEFSKHFPQYLTNAEKWLGHVHDRYPQVPDYAHVVAKAQTQISMAGQYITGSVGAVFGFVGGVVSLFTVLVFTFYILLSFEDIRGNVLNLMPKRHLDLARRTMGKMSAAMGGWLRGMILLSIIVGTTVSVVMAMLGVPYAYVIGIAGAIGEPIPMVGPMLAAVLGLMIAAFGPTWKLAVAAVFFIILALVESNVLAPKIMQRQVGLSPLTTIMALASGAALLGAVGALLAVPVAAALRVFYFEVVVPAVKRAQAARETAQESE